MGQMLSKHVNGTGPVARMWTLTYRYPFTPNPTSSVSRNAGLSMLFTNSQIPHPTTSAANMKWHINWFWNPANSQVSTSDNVTGPPPPFPFSPLAAPANSLPLQLMKAIVLLRAPYIFFPSGSFCSSQTLPFFFIFFSISPFQAFLLY